jgi:hypothetical protein
MLTVVHTLCSTCVVLKLAVELAVELGGVL